MKSAAHNKLVGKARALITTLGWPFRACCQGFCPFSLHCNRTQKQNAAQMSRVQSVGKKKIKSQSTCLLKCFMSENWSFLSEIVFSLYTVKMCITARLICIQLFGRTTTVNYYSQRMSSQGKDDIRIGDQT